MDKVSLVKKTETPVKPSTENLDKAVAEAGKINRDEYTNESLAKLDQALAAADVLLAGSTYTEILQHYYTGVTVEECPEEFLPQ